MINLFLHKAHIKYKKKYSNKKKTKKRQKKTMKKNYFFEVCKTLLCIFVLIQSSLLWPNFSKTFVYVYIYKISK